MLFTHNSQHPGMKKIEKIRFCGLFHARVSVGSLNLVRNSTLPSDIIDKNRKSSL